MFFINAILELLIGLPALLGWIRYPRIRPDFYPFIWLLTLGFINEIAGILSSYYFKTSALSYNLFGLVAALLLLVQFHKWLMNAIPLKIFYVIAVIFIFSFCAEWYYAGSLWQFLSYSTILRAAVLVVLSMYCISKRSTNSLVPAYRNPVFLICFGLIILYSNTLLVETLLLLGKEALLVQQLLVVVLIANNLFVNLLFLYAILCIPLNIRYFQQQF